MSKLIIALDFDGTVVQHGDFPTLGKPVPYALHYIRLLQLENAKIFLWTCRDGEALRLAVNYIEDNDIRLVGYNFMKYWPGFDISKKLFAHVYVDDAALGAPLVYPDNSRPYLNWSIAGPALVARASEARRGGSAKA